MTRPIPPAFHPPVGTVRCRRGCGHVFQSRAGMAYHECTPLPAFRRAVA